MCGETTGDQGKLQHQLQPRHWREAAASEWVRTWLTDLTVLATTNDAGGMRETWLLTGAR